MLDLFPTLNDLCKLPKVNGLSGYSITTLLRDPNQNWERPAITSHGQGNHAIRTKNWRYIRYADGGEELYDHQSDPHEWDNLADQPKHRQLKSELAQWVPAADVKPAGKKKN